MPSLDSYISLISNSNHVNFWVYFDDPYMGRIIMEKDMGKSS